MAFRTKCPRKIQGISNTDTVTDKEELYIRPEHFTEGSGYKWKQRASLAHRECPHRDQKETDEIQNCSDIKL